MIFSINFVLNVIIVSFLWQFLLNFILMKIITWANDFIIVLNKNLICFKMIIIVIIFVRIKSLFCLNLIWGFYNFM